MCVARNIIKNPKLVPGGGATEMAISASLKAKSSFVEGVDKVFTYAFVIPIYNGRRECASF